MQLLKLQTLTALGAAALLVAACGGRPDDSENGGDQAGGASEIVIEPVGDQMKYKTEEFTVKSGEKVRLVMNNTATVAAMVHNIVVLKPDADINKVGMAGVEAGEAKGYIPDDSAVLFHTELAKPGETTSVEFTAPEPGKYPYICTFPGHFGTMRGVMIVE